MNLLGVLVVALGIAASIGWHELGHLWPAKRYGVKVTQYMIGFGPTVWSRRRGETEYGFKLIPLGGYIRMIGMFPPSSGDAQTTGPWRALVERARAESFAEVSAEDAHRTFWRLPVRRRLIIMTGGPLMNLLLSAVLFTIALSVVGQPVPSQYISTIVKCVPTTDNPEGLAGVDGSCSGSELSFAAQYGLRSGDKVTAIDGEPVVSWKDVTSKVRARPGKTVGVTISRAPDVSLTITGTMTQRTDGDGVVGFLGTRPQFVYKTSSPVVVPRLMWETSVASGQALLRLPASTVQLAMSTLRGEPRQVDGPVSVVGIADVGGQIASSGQSLRDMAGMFLGLLASINLFLFLFNLIPLLPLDGGHVAGALWEATRRSVARVRGRPDPGPVDSARMLPVAYAVALLLLAMSTVVILADVFNPISLS